ncbi:MAG TPA: glutathione S-transferase family protein [SAR86 cluster bacterium]|jgi:glutathione S-transferase|nr:glutathione S-transferase family protein [SAR86 cluster bacterium]|tara:strand:- start:5202 stop:5954 length:753 start_codon:yes stop_codon:yes gene_type:complete
MSSPIKIYGVPFSQPVRAVLWLLLYKQQSFELSLVNPGSSSEGGSRHPDYLDKFPTGTIPSLEDKDTGFVLSESHAIMCYLCNKYDWNDLYPSNHEERAKVDSYLHLHHRNVREASIGLVAPKVRKDLNFPEDFLKMSKANIERAFNAIENGWLSKSRYLIGDGLTIADMAAYVEIGQLQSMFTNVYDFEPFPNIRRWLKDMQQVDYHDDIHVALYELGDISKEAPAMETIINANKKGVVTIHNKLADME